jgi:hypothetical protein
MGGFRELKPKQVKRWTLHAKGPRTHAEAQAFRRDLVRLAKKHKTTLLNYRADAPQAKPKAKAKAKRKKR